MLLKTPSWSHSNINYAITDAVKLEEMRAEALEVDAYNTCIKARVQEAKDTLVKFIECNGPYDSTSRRKSKKLVNEIKHAGSNAFVSWDVILTNRVKSAQDKIERERQERVEKVKRAEAEDEKLKKLACAVEYLISKGWVSKDGSWIHPKGGATHDHPIDIANAYAVQEEVNRLIADGETVSCHCDECDKWNLMDTRCECGNRRIELDWSGDFEKGVYVWGVPY